MMKKILNLPVGKLLIILQAVVILILLLFLNKCNRGISKEEQDLKLEQYKRKEQKFNSVIDNLGRELNSQKQININKDKEFEKIALKNSELKHLAEQIKIESETKIKNIISKYSDVKYIIDTVFIDSSHYILDTTAIKVGSKFSTDNKWFMIRGKLEKQGIKLDSLSIYNSYTITIGTKKKSLFKPSQTYVELFNENPYSRTISMNNIKVIDNKKWFQKGIVKFLFGVFIGGVLVGSLFLIK